MVHHYNSFINTLHSFTLLSLHWTCLTELLYLTFKYCTSSLCPSSWLLMEKVNKANWFLIKFMMFYFNWVLITAWQSYTVLLVNLLSISEDDHFMPALLLPTPHSLTPYSFSVDDDLSHFWGNRNCWMLTPYWNWKSTCISNYFLLPSYYSGEDISSLLKANSSATLVLSSFISQRLHLFGYLSPVSIASLFSSHSTKSFISCKACSKLRKHKNENDFPWSYQCDFCLSFGFCLFSFAGRRICLF